MRICWKWSFSSAIVSAKTFPTFIPFTDRQITSTIQTTPPTPHSRSCWHSKQQPRNWKRSSPPARASASFTSKSHHLDRQNMADVETVLAGKYPAKEHARKVVQWMRKTIPDISGTLYLEGQKTRMIEDNDSEAPFRLASSSCPVATFE